MRKHSWIAFLLAGILLVGTLTGCGGGGNDDDGNDVGPEKRKYADLESMLDRGDYDSALYYIRDMRDKELMEANKDQMDAEAVALVNEYAGEYVVNRTSAYETTSPRTIRIQTDMTVSVDGVTYPMTVQTEKGDTAPHFEYRTPNEDGSERVCYVYPKITESGLHTLMNYDEYLRKDEVAALADEAINRIAGEYQSYRDGSLITIQKDYTVVIAGTTYPIEYTYDSYEKNVRFYAMGYSKDGLDTITQLPVKFDDRGFATLWYDYNRNDQLEIVEITAENILDYFEYSDWKLDNINKNAFGEISDVRIARYFSLKPEYVENYFPERSEVAVEIEYTSVTYDKAEVTVDVKTEEVQTQLGKRAYQYDPSNYIYSGLDRKEYYDSTLNTYVTDGYYLFYDSQYISMDQLTSQEGDCYSFKTYVYNMEDVSILRCQMKLAFKKLNS